MNFAKPIDHSIFFEGGKTGILLIHGLGGTPAELKVVAAGLRKEGFTVSCCKLAGHCGTEEDLIETGCHFESMCATSQTFGSPTPRTASRFTPRARANGRPSTPGPATYRKARATTPARTPISASVGAESGRMTTIEIANAATHPPASGAAKAPANLEYSNNCSTTVKPAPRNTSAQYALASSAARLPAGLAAAPSRARCDEPASTLCGG